MDKRLNSMAMYLPQFHRVPENDKWWGEGFTDWTTVKAAEKLFDGHEQPRVPLDGNYYNLLDKKTLVWQAELAQKYGVDAFCFYHYYFSDGKKILEKPMENLLAWKDINISYCCCWANQTWARTWSKLYEANAWSEKFEPNEDGTNPVLLKQEYGGRLEWEKHFSYLLPFFLDERYVKIDNKPVFLIYMPEDISELAEMLECWNALILKHNFDGIYVIGVNSIKLLPGISARLFQGPNAYRLPLIAGRTVKEIWKNGVNIYDYQDCWKNAVNLRNADHLKTYYGGFVDYDNTPRKGKLGVSAGGVSPDSFGENLYKLAIKNIVLGNEWLFINAWNEWGEGNYLEPDEKNKFQFLEKVQDVMERCNAPQLDVQKEWNNISEQITEDNDTTELLKMVDKYRSLYKVLNLWLTLKERNIYLQDYFLERGFGKALIYGMAELGKHLYEELGQGKLKVVGALDRRQGLTYKDLTFYCIDEELPECDVVIVTVIQDFDAIKGMLQEKTSAEIVSLVNVVNGIAEEIGEDKPGYQQTPVEG